MGSSEESGEQEMDAVQGCASTCVEVDLSEPPMGLPAVEAGGDDAPAAPPPQVRSIANGPHYVVPGQLIAAVKRTATQTYSLQPDPQFWKVFLYVLGVAAARYRIQLVQVVLMSTHYHILFVDTLGERGAFFRFFHSNLSKVTSLVRGSSRPLLGVQERTGQQEQVTLEAAIESLVYITNNPVSARICKTPEEWPGVAVGRHELGPRKVIGVKRPDSLVTRKGREVTFFNSSSWPDSVNVVFRSLAAVFEAKGWEHSDVSERLQREFELQDEAMNEPVSSGRGTSLYDRGTLRSSWWNRRKSPAEKERSESSEGEELPPMSSDGPTARISSANASPVGRKPTGFGSHSRMADGFVGVERALRIPTWRSCRKDPKEFRAMRPRIKAGRGQGEARQAALIALSDFQGKHRACVVQFERTGCARPVMFPRGTYLWNRIFGFPTIDGPTEPWHERANSLAGWFNVDCCQVITS